MTSDPKPIPSLLPRGRGRHFAIAGDSCSGVPGHLHASKLANVNAVLQRLDPQPECLIFPGDEVIGLVSDEDELRRQWSYFLETEMGWTQARRLPVFHATGNHTTYDSMSERVFSDVLSHLPRNGAPGQEGLSYFVRDGDLLFVFVHTLWSDLGGEGHLETDWLDATLRAHADAPWTFVVGHHPAYPVNGYAGTYQRCIGDEYVDRFWSILVDNTVTAYLCSHILAFDVQCHRGVLQITSAGAGTAHRMPEGIEYLHCVQLAVDAHGLRYQVLDEDGRLREKLDWPPAAPGTTTEVPWGQTDVSGLVTGTDPLLFHLRGTATGPGRRQTLLCATDDAGVVPVWIGLVGAQLQLVVVFQPIAGRSPHQWLGPCFDDGQAFALDVLIHPDMGPGGVLWRDDAGSAWSGCAGMSAWGAERISWPDWFRVGSVREGDAAQAFAGTDLTVAFSILASNTAGS